MRFTKKDLALVCRRYQGTVEFLLIQEPKRRKIKSGDGFFCEGSRNGAISNAPGQSTDDGPLADPRLADQYGILPGEAAKKL